MKRLGILGCLVLATMVLLGLGCSPAKAETQIGDRLPFVPAATWEEAKELPLEINNMSEEPGMSWYWISYRTVEGLFNVFYTSEDGRFSWAETKLENFAELPEDTWGFIRYTSSGKISDFYICQEEFDPKTQALYSSLYGFYDPGMTLTGIEYYYYDPDIQERTLYTYDPVSECWRLDGTTVSDLPFSGEEVLASLYEPDFRITVANPGLLQAESLEITDYRVNGQGDHDVWLKTNYTGGQNLVTFHYQIFVRDGDGWTMTWETDSFSDEPYFWIGEDGDHYFTAQLTDGVTTVTLNSPVINLTGESMTNIATLPDDLKIIEAGAFANDTTFQGVIMPYGLQRIENGAFSGCTSLRKVYIPSTVTYIAPDAFDGISYLIICMDQVGGPVEQFAAGKNWPCIQGTGID